MDAIRLWDEMRDAWSALKSHFRPAMASLTHEAGIDFQDWGLLLAVLNFEPEATTPSHLMVRSPFTAAEVYMERLSDLAQKKYLVESDEGKFKLTDLGRSYVNRFIEGARQAMTDVNPLSPQSAQTMALFLERLVNACMLAPEPPSHWSINLSSKLLPPLDPPLPYIEQAMTCIAAFRDDAHLAAWRNCGLSATALETLTLVWRSEVDSLDAVCQRLAHRGHNCNVYVDVLDELKRLGLIDGSYDNLWVTVNGRMFRNQVEQETEQVFFTPWTVLSEAQKAELSELFNRFVMELRQLAN